MTGPWELPGGWCWRAFEDVATIASNLVSPEDYPRHLHLAPNHIVPETGQYEGLATVEEDCVTSNKHLFKPGQIIYSKIRPYLRKAAIAKTEGLCSADMYPIETELDSRFLMWWMLSGEFTKLALKGRSVIPKINQRELKALPVPVPPLPEQQAIVEAIERMFSHLDVSREAVAIVGRKRQALRRSLLDSMTRRGPLEALCNVATTASGGTPKAGTEAYYGGEIPWAVIGDLNEGTVRATEKTITQEGLAASSAKWVEKGTLLVAMYGASIGKLGIAGQRLTTNQAIAAVTPDPARLDTKFLFYRLLADRLKLVAAGKGGSQDNISQTVLRAWEIPVPPLEEQQSAVARLDRSLAVLDATAAAFLTTDSRSTGLRRSILKAAFEGRLTANSNVATSQDLQETLA